MKKEDIQEEAKSDKDSEKLNENQDEKTKDSEKLNENQDENTFEENEEVLEEEISETEEDKLKEEISDLKEEKIRVLAEMENLRKRFDREKIDLIKYGSVNIARDILSPGDNLERALSAINKEENHPQPIRNLIDGLLMVKKELTNALEKNGITKIDTLNKKFDPNLHQAMMEIENDELDEGVVVKEIQTGYIMHNRLLRPAMVGVSKKSKPETQADTDNIIKKDKEKKEKDPKN